MLQTITKVGPLLDLFSIERPEWGVSEAAEALGMPRSSAHALLTSLVETGLLVNAGRGRYRLGWRIVELYETMRSGSDLRTYAAPVLAALSEQTGETINLGVLERGQVLYIDKVASRHQVSVTGLRVGSRLEAHCCGLGKALLAFATPAQLEAALGGTLRRYTENTITNRRALEAQLVEVRRTGIAHENGEVVRDVACVAAPVKDSFGVVVAAVSLSGPVYRIGPKREELGRAVRAATEDIGKRLAAADAQPHPVPFDDPSRLPAD